MSTTIFSKWKKSAETIFPVSVPQKSSWNDLLGIKQILSKVCNENAVMIRPDSGDREIFNVITDQTNSTLRMMSEPTKEDIVGIEVKPTFLTFYSFGTINECCFFVLNIAGLNPIGDGAYQTAYYENTPDPRGDGILERFLKDCTFLIFPKGTWVVENCERFRGMTGEEIYKDLSSSGQC